MAYDLRDRVSDRERFYIEAHYHESVTGNLEKARQVYEVWEKTYPRDDISHFNLSGNELTLGEFDRAEQEAKESLQILPGDCLSYGNLLAAYLSSDRLVEAHAIAKEAEGKKADCYHFQVRRYQLAFLDEDQAAMARVATASAGKWGVGSLDAESRTAAYYGQVKQARDFLRQAIASSERAGESQLPLLFEASAAGAEALLGNADVARREANEVLARTSGRDAQGIAALALALTGETTRPLSLADNLAKQLPQDTVVQFNYLPTIRAQLAMNRKDPAKALDALKAAAPYELGDMEGFNAMYVVFLRGEAYLMARQGSQAAAEFRKVLDHRGIVLNEVIGALARLGLARAYVLQGDSARAKVTYQDFFKLWKDADPDVPVLKQAKAAFSKLQ